MLEKLLNQKAMISTVLLAVVIGGIFSYLKMGKLEDAEIPLKTAMVITVYPGASAHEVELEVSDVLERAIQKLENVDEIKSVSEPGISKITINIQESVNTNDLPQLWDHLRRKINDVKGSLPSGAYEPIVNDDFADVYGMLYAITADGYSLKELTKYTEYIERELIDIKGVRRAQIFGKQTEAVDVLFSSEKLASLNINPMYIAMAMQNHSQIVNPGSVSIGSESVRIGVGNKISSIQEVEDLLIQVPEGGNFRLGDIATVERSVMEPKREAFYFNGIKGLTLGLSNESGINVVELGDRVNQRITELKEELPAGIDINAVYAQHDRVKVAVNNFVWNLIISVGIVMVVLLFSMGYRSGLLISSGLIFTILGTLVVMFAIDLPLHRVTLAAIILAMGMLVDNSIVVADGILIDLKNGMNRKKAFVNTAKRTAMPLLGATVVAILAFLPLAMSPNMAGEFLSSLFTVLIISLLLSWTFAMVQTPFMAKYFYRKERPKGEGKETYDTGFYKYFRQLINYTLAHKGYFLTGSVVVLIIAFYSMRFVNVEFMPGVDYDQFVVEYNLPQGTNIEKVEDDILELEDYVMNIDGVKFVAGAIGRPPARYLLMRYMPTGGNNYGELIIETEDIERVEEIIPEIRAHIEENYPDAQFRIHKYGAKFADYDVEVQFTGADPKILRQLGEEAKAIVREEPLVGAMTDSWKNQAKMLVPSYSVQRAQNLGLSRSDMGNSILVATDGMPIGAFYEGDEQMPIVLKTTSQISDNMESLLSIPVWGQQSRSSVPLDQIIDTVALKWQDEQVIRINGKRALRVQFDAIEGYTGEQVQEKVAAKINAIELPEGYEMKWEGTVASSAEANEALFLYLPLALGLMLIIIIGLFNNIKQATIIFIVVPFAFVGVSLGFNVTGLNLTFIAIIGVLGLIGMMIKNSVVLLDEINAGLSAGKSQLTAIIDAAISRMRPVMMASLTTILGMLPLITDPMFKSMAVAIMFGLAIGSVITLVVVPTLYAVFFKVETKELLTSKAITE